MADRIRRINSEDVSNAVRDLFLKANSEIGEDVRERLAYAIKAERSELARGVLTAIQENDAIASKWEVRTTALHPFFEWTSSNEGERDLRLLFYLFGFDRDRDSSSNWLLWHILFTSGSDRSRDSYGFDRTSSYTNILGVFPYWFRDTEVPYSYAQAWTPQRGTSLPPACRRSS